MKSICRGLKFYRIHSTLIESLKRGLVRERCRIYFFCSLCILLIVTIHLHDSLRNLGLYSSFYLRILLLSNFVCIFIAMSISSAREPTEDRNTHRGLKVITSIIFKLIPKWVGSGKAL